MLQTQVTEAQSKRRGEHNRLTVTSLFCLSPESPWPLFCLLELQLLFARWRRCSCCAGSRWSIASWCKTSATNVFLLNRQRLGCVWPLVLVAIERRALGCCYSCDVGGGGGGGRRWCIWRMTPWNLSQLVGEKFDSATYTSKATPAWQRTNQFRALTSNEGVLTLRIERCVSRTRTLFNGQRYVFCRPTLDVASTHAVIRVPALMRVHDLKA